MKNIEKGRRVERTALLLSTGAAIAYITVAIKQQWISERYVYIFAGWLLANVMPMFLYFIGALVAAFFPGNLYKSFLEMSEGCMEVLETPFKFWDRQEDGLFSWCFWYKMLIGWSETTYIIAVFRSWLNYFLTI